MPTTNPLTVLPPPTNMPYLGMMLLQEGKCPYFADRRPTLTALAAPPGLSGPEFYETLSAGMRRSGQMIYRPICKNCRKCFALRLRVEHAKLSTSQKRVLKRGNLHFISKFEKATLTTEKIALYQRYQAKKHGEILSDQEATEVYERFLVNSCVDTRELQWRTKEGRLIGVGVLDITQTAVSSVYFYWDPDFASFSLGTYSVLKEIELAKNLGLTHYYLGYFVPGSVAMEYKIHFGPAEIFNGESWERLSSREELDAGTFVQLLALEQSNRKQDSKRFDLAQSIELNSPTLDLDAIK